MFWILTPTFLHTKYCSVYAVLYLAFFTAVYLGDGSISEHGGILVLVHGCTALRYGGREFILVYCLTLGLFPAFRCLHFSATMSDLDASHFILQTPSYRAGCTALESRRRTGKLLTAQCPSSWARSDPSCSPLPPLAGYVHGGGCEILPGRAGFGPGPPAQPGHHLQRPEAWEVSEGPAAPGLPRVCRGRPWALF